MSQHKLLEAAATTGRRRAVTLIELVMVLTIMACVAGVAYPRFNNAMRRHRLDAAARQVTEDLRLVRSQAIRDKADRSVTFSLAGRSYTLDQQKGNRLAGEAYQVTIRGSDANGVRLKTASFGGATQLTFNKLGIPTAGGDIVLTDGVEEAVLTVSAATGRVSRTFRPAANN